MQFQRTLVIQSWAWPVRVSHDLPWKSSVNGGFNGSSMGGFRILSRLWQPEVRLCGRGCRCYGWRPQTGAPDVLPGPVIFNAFIVAPKTIEKWWQVISHSLRIAPRNSRIKLVKSQKSLKFPTSLIVKIGVEAWWPASWRVRSLWTRCHSVESSKRRRGEFWDGFSVGFMRFMWELRVI